jgi:hypothetical protein
MIRLDTRTLRFALACGVAALWCATGCDDGSDKEAADAATEGDAAEDEDAGAAHDGGHDLDDAGMDGGSSDASTADAAAGGNDAGAGGSDTGAASDTGSGNDASAGGDAAAGPSCSEYCTKIMANCTSANAQYSSMAMCMAVCASFPVGATADTMGNTLGCRQYHAGAASGDATLHCNHAGITGGDKDPTDSAGSACGEGCDAFCNAAVTSCGSTFPSKAACMAECKMFPAGSTNFSTADTAGNTFNCRAYHLTAASTTPAPHCTHISKVSSTCK